MPVFSDLMNLLSPSLLGLFGLLVLTSCRLFEPETPYNQGGRSEPLVLDRPLPETRRAARAADPKPVDYLLPWRLVRGED